MASTRKICVGQFAGAHGVRGLVKLRSFTAEPEAIFTYAPLTDKEGEREFRIEKKTDMAQSRLRGTSKASVPQSSRAQSFIIKVEGVDNKEAADKLRGDRLYIPHDLLPQTRKNEYYEADLMGLKAVDEKGEDYGCVIGVFDYGAGIFLEIGASKKDSFMLPFKDAFVPEVDLDAGKMVIVLPVEAT
ncbi:MAG: ribosome maturation factor RimM [Bdellovibrionales bacterium]|jgi:16S rRNA processing protein RimM